MGIFDALFGNKNDNSVKKSLPWISLDKISQLDTIISDSNDKFQVIFKHSTRCGISRSVLNRFVDSYNLKIDNLTLYYLDLLNHREVSNEVGYKFQVIHQSPQLILIKNEKVIYHASHHEIQFDDILALIS